MKLSSFETLINTLVSLRSPKEPYQIALEDNMPDRQTDRQAFAFLGVLSVSEPKIGSMCEYD